MMNKKVDILRTRPSWITVDPEAIQENARIIMQYTGAKRLIAVVKANAYGFGAVATVKALYEIGVRDFAVATVAEAAIIRQEVTFDDFQILLLGVQDVSFVDIMVAYHLSPAVGDLSWLQQAVQLIPDGKVLEVQLAIDTGIFAPCTHS